MIYTIMPDGVQMEYEDPGQQSMQVAGRAAVGQLSGGYFTLGRLYSTNPRDYLDPQFSPGARRPVAECSMGTGPQQGEGFCGMQVILSPRERRWQAP